MQGMRGRAGRPGPWERDAGPGAASADRRGWTGRERIIGMTTNGGRPAPRSRAQRKADALAILGAAGAGVWVASASADGTPYLVPLSLAWLDERAVLAVAASSRTALNIAASGTARLGA